MDTHPVLSGVLIVTSTILFYSFLLVSLIEEEKRRERHLLNPFPTSLSSFIQESPFVPPSGRDVVDCHRPCVTDESFTNNYSSSFTSLRLLSVFFFSLSLFRRTSSPVNLSRGGRKTPDRRRPRVGYIRSH